CGAWWMLVLSWLVISIGIGSALFHSFANGWSMLADVVPIGIYMYVFIGFCAAVLLGHHWPGVVLALLGLLVLLALGSRLPSEPFNGSNSYFGAAAALLGLALLCRRAGHPAWRDLAIAFGLFCVSLTLRSIDMAVCERWPLGTHFLWHSFNALLLYFTLRAAAIGLRWRALDPSSIVSNAQANPGDTSNGGSTRR
ncbi:MAG: hypothetical protein KDK91_23525, partial [Gammaproteobacteria bacterium]|nr:hypothetical protein [Gammaproteobacteria bacterium]